MSECLLYTLDTHIYTTSKSLYLMSKKAAYILEAIKHLY